MNWTFTFVFSDFPNHLLNAFWDHFFMDFYQSGRILSHSAVFMLLCVLLHHFFSVFCSYVNHLNMPFASSWHNVVLLELSTLFVKLRLIFVSFSHFPLIFALYLSLFSLIISSTQRFEPIPPLRETPERSFIIWNTAKNWSPWVSSPRCPAQRFTFWIKRSIPPPYGKTCSPRLKKRSFPGSSAIFFTQKKAPEPRCSYFMTYIVPPAAANGSILRMLSQRITPSTHSIFSAAAVPTSRRSRTRTFYTYSSSSPSSSRSSDVQPT